MVLLVNALFEAAQTHTGKTTAIRRIAVRETLICRHKGETIKGPPDILRTAQHYCIEGLKVGPYYNERRQSLRQLI